MKAGWHQNTRKDKLHSVGLRAQKLNQEQSAAAWTDLAVRLVELGDLDGSRLPKFNDLLNSIMAASVAGRRGQKVNKRVQKLTFPCGPAGQVVRSSNQDSKQPAFKALNPALSQTSADVGTSKNHSQAAGQAAELQPDDALLQAAGCNSLQLQTPKNHDPGTKVVHEVTKLARNKSYAAKRETSLAMARAAGADLVRIGSEKPSSTVVVLCWGSGLLMATCDHLVRAYPDLGILGADLPLGLGVHQRVVIIDYLATVWPTYLVVWAAGIPAVEYLRGLQARRLKVHRGWLSLKPESPPEQMLEWAKLGFVRVWDPWAPKPLIDV